MGGIFQRCSLGESEFYYLFVGFTGAEDAVVGPDRNASPFPLFDDVGESFFDELADAGEGFSAPVCEVGDSLGDEV